MRKKYLGIICIIYSALILFIKTKGNLGNFLAPQMQKYILAAAILLLIIGLIIIFDNHIRYEFKTSDLILLLPLIMIVLAGEGRLSMNLANNRASSFSSGTNKNEKIEQKNSKQDNPKEIEYEENIDFSTVDYDVKNEAYSSLAEKITYSENVNYYLGKKIRVKGFIKKSLDVIPKKYMAFGKYVISCCAADAGMGGFIIDYDKSKVKDNNWYQIEGIIEKGKDDYGDIAVIKVINIKEINGKLEEQNIYACYSYGDSSCSILNEYDLYDN